MKKQLAALLLTGLTLPTVYASSENGTAWSPDNQHFALHSNKEGGSHLFLVNAKTSQWQQLTHEGFSRYPTWSADGKTMVFMSWQDSDKGFSSYIMNMDKKSIRRVTQDERVHLGPSISPDGKKIAYCIGGERPEIWTVNIDGSDNKKVTNDSQSGCWPKWLPDNETLVFGAPSLEDSNDFEIAKFNIKTGEYAYIFESKGNDWGAVYSKSDNRIYFNSLKDSANKDMMKGQWDIFSMTLEGNDLRKEAENSAFDSTISISNDGQYFSYAVIQDKEHKVRARNAKSKSIKNY